VVYDVSLEAFPGQQAAQAPAVDTDLVGTVKAWTGASIPGYWRLCDGSVLAASSYPDLAAVIPPASGNITLPDLRDRFILGGGAAKAMLATGGETNHTLVTAEMPAHAHGFTNLQSFQASNSPNYGYASGQTTPAVFVDGSAQTLTSTGGGGAHNNMPPYVVLAWIIKVLPAQTMALAPAGTAGQVLTKQSSVPYDTAWSGPPVVSAFAGFTGSYDPSRQLQLFSGSTILTGSGGTAYTITHNLALTFVQNIFVVTGSANGFGSGFGVDDSPISANAFAVHSWAVISSGFTVRVNWQVIGQR
jgi:microcystin-dependent protein